MPNYRHGSLSMPLPTNIWNYLKDLGLLRPYRGLRGGLHTKRTGTNYIPTIHSRRNNCFRFTAAQTKAINRSNLLNIQIEKNTTKHDFPTIFLSNTRSMVNKIDEICGAVLTNKCDIAVITESWLSSHITDNLISIPGFITVRKDRASDQRGGGLCT